MDLAYGEELKETHILVSGKTVKLMDMAYIHGLMETDIKANSRNASNTDKVFKSFQMAMYTEGSIKTENHMVTVSIFGVMDALTKANSKEGLEMEKESGENQMMPIQMFMMENLLKKRNKVMAFLHGRMAANIWDISLTMSGKVMDKCTGVMVTCIKESGLTGLKLNRFQKLH